jgi:hypothetical protein
VLLALLGLAAASDAAPVPFPKTPPTANAPATLATLQRQLLGRGLLVAEVRRAPGPGEWDVQLILQGECRGQRMLKRVRADDRRSALAELLRQGYDAESLRKAAEAEVIFNFYQGFGR